MSEIIELTDENFETHVKSADKPVLVCLLYTSDAADDA